MKLKILFLFFILFFSCKKSNHVLTNQTNIYYSDSIYKQSLNSKVSLKKRLSYSKELLGYTSLADSLQYKILNNTSYLYSKLNRLDSAILLSKKMVTVSKEDNKIAYSYLKLGRYFDKKNLKDSSYYYYNKSKDFYIKIKDSVNYRKLLLNLAILESDFGSYSLSDSSAVQCIKYIKRKKNQTVASAFNCLAINSKKRLLYSEAINYYNKALFFSEKESSRIKYKNNIAILFKDQKKFKEAIEIFENLLLKSNIKKNTKARVLSNLVYTKWLQNSESNVLKDLLFATSLKKKNNDEYGLIASYSHLSEYFYDSDNLKSLSYAYKMYDLSKQLNSFEDRLKAIDKIVELETPQKTIKYYKESIRLRDSLQKEETKRQYKFASIKYNYEEEEKQKLQFKALATENELVAEQEKSEKKNIIIFAIVFFSGLIIYIFRRRQLHGKKLLEERYTTETRIAKQLHDDLGNTIYNTLVKVQDSNYTTAEIVNDLDKVYLKTRKISHDNDSVETGVEFENYLKQLLTSYNNKDCKIILKDFSVLELNTLKKEKQIVLYRVCNELLVNMKKHSNANLVVISCKKENKFLEINYADNGVGFQNNDVIFKNGLKNMETRIKGIGGTFSFDSASEKGCKVKIRFKN